MLNKRFVLASRPVGPIKESDFRMESADVPPVKDGEMLIKVSFLSVDPYMRGRMSAAKSYSPPVELDGLMVGAGVGEVIESKNNAFKTGDIVTAHTGWQEYAISDGSGARKVDARVASISTALGVLGMTGLTAYFGLLDVCGVKPNETVVVSGAAGAVGSVVGQIAKLEGCRAVGVAGGAHKARYLINECGFDAVLDYKATPDYFAGLRGLCPAGVDVYFDNVGGPISDAVMMQLNLRARIAICGQIATYNATTNDLQATTGPRLMRNLLVARARVQGFLIFDYTPAQQTAALVEMSEWVRVGKIKYREDIVEGFENMPKALIGLFLGENIGKRVVRVA